ncbi:MAG: hypothetical protein JNM00_08710 [Flavobacteriales bacterium]|nr:hypothetical protein [Flavobacteriales bacterium]
MNTNWTLNDVKRYIDSFARPNGYNPYAWSVAKKLALEVWESYLAGRPFRRPVNYMCREFYKMIERPDGQSLIPRGSYRCLHQEPV